MLVHECMFMEGKEYYTQSPVEDNEMEQLLDLRFHHMVSSVFQKLSENTFYVIMAHTSVSVFMQWFKVTKASLNKYCI